MKASRQLPGSAQVSFGERLRMDLSRYWPLYLMVLPAVMVIADDPAKISKAIKISRKCIGIVYQNIVFALAVKFACLVLVAVGVADMWAAIFADVGVMVLAVLNAIRALRVHDL